MREHGIGAASSSLIIEVRPLAVRVDDDNDDVVRCVAEQLRLLTNRFRPAVLKWSVAAAKLGADQRLLRRVLDLKADVDVVTSKCNELQLGSSSIVKFKELLVDNMMMDFKWLSTV